MAKRWWQTQFSDAVRYMKDYLWQESLTENQVAFVMKHLPKAAKSLLDVPCGYGRHSLLLSSTGLMVWGVDNSASMVDMAINRAKAAGAKLFPKYVVADMRKKLPFKFKFDAVVNLFTSFGYFGNVENKRSLNNMVRALNTGGLFILDTVNPESVRGSVDLVNGFKVWNFNANYVVGKVMLYDKEWFLDQLDGLGVTDIKVYGWYDDSEYTNSSKRMIFVGVKK